MTKKGKKIQTTGNNDLKVDLWGNLSEATNSSQDNSLKTPSEKSLKKPITTRCSFEYAISILSRE